jgi:hypothetical protein
METEHCRTGGPIQGKRRRVGTKKACKFSYSSLYFEEVGNASFL